MKHSTARDLLMSTTSVNGSGRAGSRRDPWFRIDPAEIRAWNDRQQRAISANRFRESREKFLDSLYIYNERAR